MVLSCRYGDPPLRVVVKAEGLENVAILDVVDSLVSYLELFAEQVIVFCIDLNVQAVKQIEEDISFADSGPDLVNSFQSQHDLALLPVEVVRTDRSSNASQCTRV